MTDVKFKKGKEANIPKSENEGVIVVTEDTGKLFLGKGATSPLLPLGGGDTTVLEKKVDELERSRVNTSKTFTEDFLGTSYVDNSKTDAVVGSGYVRGDALKSFTEDFSTDGGMDKANSTQGVLVNTAKKQIELDANTLNGIYRSVTMKTQGTTHATLDYSATENSYMNFAGATEVSTEQITRERGSCRGVTDRSGRFWLVEMVRELGIVVRVWEANGNLQMNTVAVPLTGNTTWMSSTADLKVTVDYNNRLWIAYSASAGFYYMCLNPDATVYVAPVRQTNTTYMPFDMLVDNLNQIWFMYQRKYMVVNSTGAVLKTETNLSSTSSNFFGCRMCLDTKRSSVVMAYVSSSGASSTNMQIESYDITTRNLKDARVQILNLSAYNPTYGFDLAYNGVTDVIELISARINPGVIQYTEFKPETFAVLKDFVAATDTSITRDNYLSAVVDQSTGNTHVCFYSTDVSAGGTLSVVIHVDGTSTIPIFVGDPGVLTFRPNLGFDANGNLFLSFLWKKTSTVWLSALATYTNVKSTVNAYISNDNGLTWLSAPSGAMVQFPATGQELKVQYDMSAPYYGYSPTITHMSITEGSTLSGPDSRTLVSKQLPSIAPILQALVTVDVELNGGTVEWHVSNDGGSNWVTFTPGDLVNFQVRGNKLLIKAIINKPVSEIKSPYIRGYTVTSYGSTMTYGGSGAHPGSVMYFSAETAPDGWLKANGAELPRDVYSDLFQAIGVTFGAGDGLTTFNLPDLRGEFLRGWDDGRGVDVARSLGSSQNGTSFPNWWSGTLTGVIPLNMPGATDIDEGLRLESTEWKGLSAASGAYTYTGYKLYRARPRNVSLLPCIKF